MPPTKKDALAPYKTALGKIELHIRELIPVSMRTTLQVERFTLLLLQRIAKSPKLRECSPLSIVEFALEAACLGLLPGGPLAQIHPLPFKGVCTAVIDYRGYIALARRSGLISRVHADIVRAGDEFIFAKRPWPTLEHEIKLGSNRGPILGSYCIAQYVGDSEQITLCDAGEIEKAKEKSPSRTKPVWNEFPGPMATKTVVRKAAKLWPITEEMEAARSLDDEGKSYAIPQDIYADALEVATQGQPKEITATERARMVLAAQKEPLNVIEPTTQGEAANADVGGTTKCGARAATDSLPETTS